jgi:hypothetical protein
MTALIVLCVQNLPSPSSYTIIGIGSGFGWFIGRLLGRVRHLPSERVTEFQSEGMFWGIGAAFTLWLVALAINEL